MQKKGNDWEEKSFLEIVPKMDICPCDERAFRQALIRFFRDDPKTIDESYNEKQQYQKQKPEFMFSQFLHFLVQRIRSGR